ncbi:MAG: helix-turn-helix domain-containing protein [Dokdonella sp.]
MTIERDTIDLNSPLAAVGIDDQEERAWRILLSLRTATVDDVAAALGLPPRKAQRLLDAVEAKGLASHSPERPRRYIPTSPDIAIESLVKQRRQDLERALSTIPELNEHAAAAPGASGREQTIEIITNRDAIGQVYAQLQRTMETEVVCLQRAPVIFSSLDEVDEAQKNAYARGVRSRSISDAEFLALPGAVKRMRLDIEAGEEVRVFPQLPFKMLIIDRRIGLLALHVHKPDGPSLLVRSSALLDALYALFENLWERATPVVFTRSGVLKSGGQASRLPPSADDLIALLAVGLNDKAIAHELGISASTLNRRIAELLKGADASSRFQLGWLLRGLVGEA